MGLKGLQLPGPSGPAISLLCAWAQPLPTWPNPKPPAASLAGVHTAFDVLLDAVDLHADLEGKAMSDCMVAFAFGMRGAGLMQV